jgi:PAS domain S-box-containing protein
MDHIPPRPIKVLLIDGDSQASAELCRKLTDVKTVSFNVEISATLSEGLQLLAVTRFDAVLVDLSLADASGIASLKALQVRAAETPVVVISSVYQDSEALETVRAGAQDYLVKNRVNPAALERILVHCIERQRARSRTTMQYLISRVLAETETLPEATAQILRVLCESLEYDFAQAWSFDHWSSEFIPAETWHVPSENYAKFAASNRKLRFEAGTGVPGRSWARGIALWIPDVAQEPEFWDCEQTLRAGLRSVFAFPISLGTEVLGVIELFSPDARQPDDDLRTIITNIGSQMGQFMARKRAEEQKERLTQERLLILDSASEGIYGLDLNGCITFMNRSAARMFRCNAAEINGQHLHELFHHTHPDGSPYPAQDCPIQRVFATGEGSRSDTEYFWRADGTHLAVDYSAFPVIEGGRIKGAVVCFNDITDRKRMEVELRHAQKLEAVGGLAAGIAHEINTPIQFIGDNTRFLQESFRERTQMQEKYEEICQAARHGPVPAQLLDDVQEIRKRIDWDYLRMEVPKAMAQMLDGIDRVAKIVRAMKDFSHVDRSSQKTPADLNKSLESTLVVARAELKYVADVSEDYGELPPVLCCIGDLNQVFLNLLINAAHAIGDVMKKTGNKGRIVVKTRQEDDWAEVSISDTGTGIPEAAREKIFDPFFTTKEVGKGTGQGLTLARAIVVEKHGGTLTFDTEVGKGTTFHVRLPVNGVRDRQEAVAQ